MPLDPLNFKGKFGDLCVALFLLNKAGRNTPTEELQLKKQELSPGLHRIIFLASGNFAEIDTLGEVDPVPAHHFTDVMSPIAVAAAVEAGAVIVTQPGGDLIQFVIHRWTSLP